MDLGRKIIGHVLRDVRDALDKEPFGVDPEKASRLDAPVHHPFKGAVDTPYLTVPIFQKVNIVADRWARRDNGNLAPASFPGYDPREVSSHRTVDVLLARLGIGNAIDIEYFIRSADGLFWRAAFC